MAGKPVAERPPSGEAEFVVRAFRPEDYDQIASIFVDGSLRYPELRNNAGGGNFWVATPADESSHVVGVVGLEGKPGQEGELRRLSVKSEFRRFGIARLLVSTLEHWAKAHGFRAVRLTTGLAMDKAQAFYTAAGYTRGEMNKFLKGYSFFGFEKRLQ